MLAQMIEIFVFIWYVLSLVLCIGIYIQQIHTPRLKITKEQPEPIKNSTLCVLLHKKIIPQLMCANLVELINQKILVVKRKDNDYILSLEGSTANIQKHQSYLLDFVIDQIGNGNQVSLDQIMVYCRNHKNCTRFLLEYRIWLKMVKIESDKHLYFETKKLYRPMKMMRLFGFVLVVVHFLNIPFWYIGYGIIPVIVLTWFLFSYTEKRNAKGMVEYEKWISYQQHILKLERKQMPDQELRQNLMYAVLFNKIEHFERKHSSQLFVTTLDQAIKTCYKKATLHGYRGSLYDLFN